MKVVTTILLTLIAGVLLAQQVINLEGSWKFHIGDRQVWSTPEYNDEEWEYIVAPSAWEDEGFNGYDGFAWYRKKFNGRELSRAETYYLNLGYIDDADEVYLNGYLIGFSGYMPPKFKTAYNTERRYNLPGSMINFQGDNIIAIRIFDVTLGGGIIDGPLGIYKAPRSRLLLDLQGLWDFSLSRYNTRTSRNTDWEKIMVPSPWEHQGFSKYDGFAWYKKSFEADKTLISQDGNLVLLLGKIDDFDEVYLNGKSIGKTNDNRPFGISSSYERLRAYDIPAHLLRSGENIIEVMVEDMGNIGGIYEGPIGITTRTLYERYYR